jgi:hypothetical protein
MQLVSCQNSSGINKKILTVARGNNDIIMPVATMVTIAMDNYDISNARGYCGWLLCYCWSGTTSLSKVGIDQLKELNYFVRKLLGLVHTCTWRLRQFG